MPNRGERRRLARKAAAQWHIGNIQLPPLSAPHTQNWLIWRNVWFGIVAFGTILGLITGIFFFKPALSATPSTTLFESDPMSAFFTIANEGNLDLNNAHFSCRVNYATDGHGLHIAMSENTINETRARFPAKEKIGLPCLASTHLTSITVGDISIQVRCRPSFWPWALSWESRFRTFPGDNGKLHWMPEIEPFVFDQNMPPPR